MTSRLDISKHEIIAAAEALIAARYARGEMTLEAGNARWDAMEAAEQRLDQALARRDAIVRKL